MKEAAKARKTYHDAVLQGETAGLFEQLSHASDVFRTRLGNIPAGESVFVEIAYVGELKQDAEVDGIRFTLPTMIASRYGTQSRSDILKRATPVQEKGGIEITVDASMAEGSVIRSIQSPTHAINVTMGNLSTSTDSDSDTAMHQASATLSLETTALDKDFVLIIVAKDTGTPKALLETHPTIPNQRALMVTLVPNFSLPPTRPEIVFVADRSGSMQYSIPTLISALKVFLKSLPVGVMFNICSFGFTYSFLWPKSRAYSNDSLAEAMAHVEQFEADFGGTETFKALSATIENRCRDVACEVMLLTDGQIYNQTEVFSYLNQQVRVSEAGLRVFTLGIGNGVSHALVEGIARAGNGFAQTVGSGERLDKKVIRMLKGALSPHIKDCELEIEYGTTETEDDSFEIVERVTESLKVLVTEDSAKSKQESSQKPILFFDTDSRPGTIEVPPSAGNDKVDPYAHLPTISVPNLLQSPSAVPQLFSFSRTVIYIILSPETVQEIPKSVILRGKSPHGPLELKISVETVSQHCQMIHQLAARKVIQELEESSGWIFDARDETRTLIKERFPSRFAEIVEREAVRLGTRFQVSGKWCSFVAVSENGKDTVEDDWAVGSSHSACTLGPTFEFANITYQGNLDPGPTGGQRGPVERGLSRGSATQFLSRGGCKEFLSDEANDEESDDEEMDFEIFQCSVDEEREGESEMFSAIEATGGTTGGKRHLNNSTASSNNDKVHSIIELQSFEGYWNINEGLRKVMGVDKEIVDLKGQKTTWNTILVVTFLETKMEEEKDVWELVVEKARAWLRDQNQATESWEQEARKLFGA